MPSQNYKENAIWCADRAEDHRGTVVLEKGGVSTTKRLLWTCEYGHEWKANINNMKSKNTWCPECCKHITEKFVGYCLNQLFGDKYLFTTKQLECLKDRTNVNCDLVNEELGVYIEVDGWATHGENKDKDLMTLIQKYNTNGEDPEKYCKENEKFKSDKMEEANLKLIRIEHKRTDTFEDIAELLLEKLEHLKHKFIIDEDELLDNLPNKADVATHYYNRRKREIEIELEKRKTKLKEFKFEGRQDKCIDVYCTKCKIESKLWSFDDIMRNDKNARKLCCEKCKPTKIDNDNIKEFCESYGFQFVSKQKNGKDYLIKMICPNGTEIEKTKGNLKRDKKCKCKECKKDTKK